MAFNKIHDEKKGIALTDFLRDFNETPFELIDGERILWMPGVARHTETMEFIKDALKDYLRANPVGSVFTEATYVVEYSKDWVKGSLTPDLLFFAAERLAQYKADNPDWGDKPYVLVPDIAIEVVSPNDSYSHINRKVMTYLDDGVQQVWVIDPQAENALVHTENKTIILSKDDSITGGDILPDFELPLKSLMSSE
jgi:Uma2 family endonuclease